MTVLQRIELDRKEAQLELDLWEVIGKHKEEVNMFSMIYVLGKMITHLASTLQGKRK